MQRTVRTLIASTLALTASLGAIGVTGAQTTEVATLSSPEAIGDSFGFSVAIEGDTALVGTPYFDIASSPSNEGAVYVFERTGSVWSEQQRLTASDASYGDTFGWSVDLSGDTAVIGARQKDFGQQLYEVRSLAFDPATNRLFTTSEASWSLAELDPASGEATSIGSLGTYQIEGLAFDPGSDTLYGSDVLSNQLVSIDTATAAVTPIGDMGFTDVTGLAFDSASGTLYGYDNFLAALLVIDPGTGAGTLVGLTAYLNVTGLAFDPVGGVLYGCDSATDKLIAIDTTTGLGSEVGPLGFNFVHGLAFDSNSDTLFGVNSFLQTLLEIDTSTGAGTIAGQFYLESTGGAYVFVHDGTSWVEQASLTPGFTIGVYPEFFGAAVSISGDLALIGSSQTNSVGAAYVFARNGTTWTEQAMLTASSGLLDDGFGGSVALSGTTAAVGAGADDHAGGAGAGSVYLFEQLGSVWSEQQKLTAGDAQPGAAFGSSVALTADTVAVGARFDSHAGGASAGSVYVFTGSGASWSEQQKLTASDAGDGDQLGRNVALFGDTLAALAPNWDGLYGNEGAVYVFGRDGGTWTEQQLLVTSEDESQRSVDLFDQTVLTGAGLVDEAWVFSLCSEPESYCTAGTTANGCQATMSAAGTPSATATSGFVVTASDVEGQKQGILFWGPTPNAAPWGQGTSFICIAPPTTRTGTQFSGGSAGACDGVLTLDFNAWMTAKPTKAPAVGSTVHMQAWFRDPPSPKNTSLSDGLRFLICP